MRQVNALTTLCFVAVFALIIASCSKDGPAGPAGATGAAGAAGPAGAAGAAGPKGDTGVANVIYSAWLDASYSADTFHIGSLIDTVYFYDASVPKLTSTILSTGEIKVYLNLGSTADPYVVPLPYVSPLSDVNEKITPNFFLQTIELTANVNASTYTSNGVKYLQWRYILIPGGKAARSAIDWNNYAEVKKYLNLKD